MTDRGADTWSRHFDPDLLVWFIRMRLIDVIQPAAVTFTKKGHGKVRTSNLEKGVNVIKTKYWMK